MPALDEIPVLPFVPKDDPILPLPQLDEIAAALRDTPEDFIAWLTERQARLDARESDPLRHGYEPPIWHVVDNLLCAGVTVRLVAKREEGGGKREEEMAPREILGGSEVLILGGNRSSKTEYAARKCMQTLVAKPNARAWALHTTGPSSIAMQHPRLWKFIPAEWRNVRKTKVANISYSQKGGFTESTFVLPNGSQCWFKNYAQDVETLEGEELDIAWTDELVPMVWLDTLRFRLATRKGLLLITFTPIKGYSPTVKSCLEGARTIAEAPAPLLPILDRTGKPTGRCELVPRVQQALRQEMKIVYLHSTDNPFGGAEEIVKKLKGARREEILVRAYGVPTKAIASRFPRFNPKIHVIDDAKIPAGGTNWNYNDPCSGRNWAMIWARVTPDERIVIYREWPCPGVYIPGVGNPGNWAEPDGEKHDGRRGRAQDCFGFGLERYRDEILAREGEEEIFERYMDSRFGAAPTLSRSDSQTLIEAMAGLDMHFRPAPGEHIDEGIDLINDLLHYDIDREIGPDNQPRLYIAESCRNTIFALQQWTGLDGRQGACKDFIDLLRYMALSRPQYLGDEILTCKRGGAY